MALDLLVGALAVVLAHLSRNYVIAPYIAPEIFKYRSLFADYWWLIIVLPVLTMILLRYHGYYQSQRVRPISASFPAILLATVGASLLATVISFIFTPRGGGQGSFLSQAFRGELVSRGILLLYPLLAMVLLAGKSLIIRALLVDLRNRGYNTRNMLLLGDSDLARMFLTHLQRHPEWGFITVGLITDDDITGDYPIPIVGQYNDLLPYLERHVIDDVVFVAARDGLDTLAPMLQGCEEMGVRTRLPVHIFRNRIARPVLDHFDDLPVITFNPVQEFGPALLFKYAFDLIVAAVLIVLLSPLMLLIALSIKLNSSKLSDPVFYGQIRCGLNGRKFTLWKFRSMVVNAERAQRDLQDYNLMGGPVFKMKDDPRITHVGRWLRKSSLDELPQLWNVLRGEMSLVGPRPALPHEVEKYDRWQRRRLSMKPGITCIWQVSGRNELSFETWMKLDLEYIDSWTTLLDFKILLRTLYVVFTGRGAM